MKRIFIVSFLAIFGLTCGFGQTGIQGGDFEHWKLIPVYNYFEPDSSYFSTLNKLDTVVAIAPMVTVYPCDTAHSGNYSAKCVTKLISSLFITIPGALGTLAIDWTVQRAILGMPYPYGDSLPDVFSGWYQSYPLNNDSSAAVILLSKWNAELHKRDTIAYNNLVFHGTIDTWTYFEQPITYWDNTTKPDSLTVLLLSCAGFNVYNMFGSVGQPGSMALFDDISLSGVNGIPLLLTPSVSVKLAPNPASGIMKVELGSVVRDGFFEIYNGNAQLLERVPLVTKNGQINVAEYAAGMYYYKLIANNKLLNSGTFVVSR
jgi:hypothetical protein